MWEKQRLLLKITWKIDNLFLTNAICQNDTLIPGRNSFSDDDLEAYDLDDTFDLSVEEKLARMSEKAKEKDIKKKQEELEG